MDVATLIGLIGALVTVVVAIFIGGSFTSFIDAPSAVIVVIGTLLVTLIKFSVGQFFGATKVAFNAFVAKMPDAEALIEKSVELANRARKDGILALEDADVPDDFFRKAVNLVVDGHDPEIVKSILCKDLELTLRRHADGQAIFKAIGDVAPAMGMIGTLIGLVQMLTVMDDPKQIGPAMAIALLTTLYGAVIATLIALPIADKLALRSSEERFAKSLVIDAVVGIQEGRNPRIIQDMLHNYLPSSRRGEDREAA